jgi:hypothetical protein
VFNVHSRFKHEEGTTRSNGVAGPFEKRDTAERALIALLQAGQATSGEIVETTRHDDDCPKHGIELRRCGCQTLKSNPLLEAAEHGKALGDD